MIPWPTVLGFWLVLSLMLAGVWIWAAAMGRRARLRRFDRHTAQALAVTRHPSTTRHSHRPPDDDPVALAVIAARAARLRHQGDR